MRVHSRIHALVRVFIRLRVCLYTCRYAQALMRAFTRLCVHLSACACIYTRDGFKDFYQHACTNWLKRHSLGEQ